MNSEELFWERWELKRSRHGARGVVVIVEAEAERGNIFRVGLPRCWAKRFALLERLEATAIDIKVRLTLCRVNDSKLRRCELIGG